MDNEIEQIKRDIFEIKIKLKEHNHNGWNGGLVSFSDLIFTIKTTTIAGELTRLLASHPTKVSEQILIDTTTATKKLYVYDMVGKVWRSTTIS